MFLHAAKNKPYLEEFKYTESMERIHHDREDGTFDLSSLSGLKSLSWTIYAGERPNSTYFYYGHDTRSQLSQLLLSSRETLESIAIFPLLSVFTDAPMVPHEETLQLPKFPNLVSLSSSIDLEDAVPMPNQNHSRLLDFLEDHPGIQHLTLHPPSNREGSIFDIVEFFIRTIGPVLSNQQPWMHLWKLRNIKQLVSYKGSIAVFFIFFGNEETFLSLSTTLQVLEFDWDLSNVSRTPEAIGHIYSLLCRNQEALKRLRLTKLVLPITSFRHAELPSYDGPTPMLELMLDIVKSSAGSIEYYHAPLPQTYSDLYNYLLHFTNLRTVFLYAHLLWDSRSENQRDSKREVEIASICEKLEWIIVISDDDDEDIICRKEIIRMLDGSVKIETYPITSSF